LIDTAVEFIFYCERESVT